MSTLKSSDRGSLDLAVAEHAPSPMALVSGEGYAVRYINPAFCRLLEKSAEQLAGIPFAELCPENSELLPLLDRVRRTGQSEIRTNKEQPGSPLRARYYTIWPVMTDECPDGIMIQISETAQLYERTIAMNEALMLGSLRQHELTSIADLANTHLQAEVSERKRAVKNLRRAKAELSDRAGELEEVVTARTLELAATNQQLEAFVYSIAHDLRAPLRSMQGFSELLVEEAGAALSVTSKDYADRINKSAQFMDALLRDLLAFSRVSQQHVELTSVDLRAVVTSVLSRLQKEIQEKPACVENVGPWPVALGHEPTLIQVLFNLVSNAVKFASPNVAPRVRLRTEDRQEFVRVWVEDNGIGIDSGHHVQIFKVFNRLQGEKFQGTGIGLAIVQKGIERMGGRVGLESACGQGSRFWFELRKVEERSR